MSAAFLSELLIFLGFIGLFAIGFLPFRAWQILRKIFKNGLQEPREKVATIFIALGAVGSSLVVAQTTARIFRCLTETYCGPSTASGWSYLAVLGAVYLLFEAASYAAQKIGGLNKTTARHN